MTDYYLDASALVKRYAKEPGSDWILQITDPGSENFIHPLPSLLAMKTFLPLLRQKVYPRRIP